MVVGQVTSVIKQVSFNSQSFAIQVQILSQTPGVVGSLFVLVLHWLLLCTSIITLHCLSLSVSLSLESLAVLAALRVSVCTLRCTERGLP